MQAMIENEITDYKKWKTEFDMGQNFRKEHGATGEEHIYRDVSDPNRVIVTLQWDNKKRFEEFFKSDEAKQRMEKAGVKNTNSMLAYEAGGDNASCTAYKMH